MFLPHCRPALYHLRDYCYPCGSKISLEMRTTKPETDIRCRLIGMKQGERTQKIAKYVWASHARKERVITNVTDSRECHSGIVFTICTNQFHLPENGREGLKLVSNMALKKWNTNFCWDIQSGKSGLSFQMYRCSWKFSAGTTKKVMFRLLSNQRRSERLPTVHCDCVSSKMAEFSFARCVFTVFLCVIFTGLES